MHISDNRSIIQIVNGADSTISTSGTAINCEAIVVKSGNTRWLLACLFYDSSEGGLVSSASLIRISSGCNIADAIAAIYNCADAKFDRLEIQDASVDLKGMRETFDDSIRMIGSDSETLQVGDHVCSIPFNGRSLDILQGPGGLLTVENAAITEIS